MLILATLQNCVLKSLFKKTIYKLNIKAPLNLNIKLLQVSTTSIESKPLKAQPAGGKDDYKYTGVDWVPKIY